MNYKDSAEQILKLVGGAENILTMKPDDPSASVMIAVILWSVLATVLSFLLVYFFGDEKTERMV